MPFTFGVVPLIKGVVVSSWCAIPMYQICNYRLIGCSWREMLVLLAVQAKTRDFIRMLMLGAYTMEAIPIIAGHVADRHLQFV